LTAGLAKEHALCRCFAWLVEAGLPSALDVQACFALPATSIYCPAIRHVVDVFALLSEGVNNPAHSCVGPEAALLCEVRQQSLFRCWSLDNAWVEEKKSPHKNKIR
jgi:hypothetical protein